MELPKSRRKMPHRSRFNQEGKYAMHKDSLEVSNGFEASKNFRSPADIKSVDNMMVWN